MAFSACRDCTSYNRGAGTKQCFKCDNYKEVMSQYTDRETIRVISLPTAIMEEVADRSHMGKGMLWAIRKLDTQDMAIALLKYYGEITIREIAEGLSVSDSFIEKRLREIRKGLKIILSEANSTSFTD